MVIYVNIWMVLDFFAYFLLVSDVVIREKETCLLRLKMLKLGQIFAQVICYKV